MLLAVSYVVLLSRHKTYFETSPRISTSLNKFKLRRVFHTTLLLNGIKVHFAFFNKTYVFRSGSGSSVGIVTG